jgi:hypothetical protein
MAATRRLQKELLDIRREEKETVSIILMSSVRNSWLLFSPVFIFSIADPHYCDEDRDGIRITLMLNRIRILLVTLIRILLVTFIQILLVTLIRILLVTLMRTRVQILASK